MGDTSLISQSTPHARRHVTAADVARRAGVARTTVSMVLRGEAEQRGISPTTAERILAVAKELDYVPNHVAREFRRQRSTTIGVVLADYALGWVDNVMLGMEQVFGPTEYMPFVAVHRWSAQRAQQELLACIRRRDEAIVFFFPVPPERDLVAPVLDRGIPLIFLADRPEGIPEASFVGWDAGPAARVAVEHLVQTGYRRIGFFGVDYPTEMSRARHSAYVNVLREAGLPLNERWNVLGAWDSGWVEVLQRGVDGMFAPGQEHPDAVFALNDAMGISLVEALGARGIRVPEDVAVIGMGDLEVTERRGISLSTVREPLWEMGQQAAEIALELIADPRRAPIHRLIPGQELKVRRTTQPVMSDRGFPEP